MGVSVAMRKRVALSIVLALSLIAILQGYRLVQLHGFNRALDVQDLNRAASYAFPEAAFARALVLESRGAFAEALKRYADIAGTAGEELRLKALYNSANSHLRRGLDYLAEGNMDRALPMIEMAKFGYRQALDATPSLWDARFNLARAVLILPETDIEEVEEDIMPERSQRSLVPMPIRRELP